MNPLPASYISTRSQKDALKEPMSLSDRLANLASFAASLESQVFQTGMRLGVLQPLPTPGQTSGQPAEPHIVIPLNQLESSLQRMAEDLNRIRNFVG